MKLSKEYQEMMNSHNITEEEIEEYIQKYSDSLDSGEEFREVEQGSEEYDRLMQEAAIVSIATERLTNEPEADYSGNNRPCNCGHGQTWINCNEGGEFCG